MKVARLAVALLASALLGWGTAHAADLPCEEGLTCRPAGSGAAFCAPFGDGTSECGSPGDAPCAPGTNCHCRSQCMNPDSSPGLQSCLDDGTGNEFGPCGQPGDAPCQAGLVCRPTDDDTICSAPGTGGQGDFCQLAVDAPCNGGRVCRPQPLGAPARCDDPSDGSNGADCGVAGDAACQAGLTCSGEFPLSPECRPVGTGAIGQRCGAPNDAPCAAGSCRDQGSESFCTPPGDGSDGAVCGGPGDAPCEDELVALLCDADTIDGFSQCRPAGLGTVDERCDNVETEAKAPALGLAGIAAVFAVLLIVGLRPRSALR